MLGKLENVACEDSIDMQGTDGFLSGLRCSLCDRQESGNFAKLPSLLCGMSVDYCPLSARAGVRLTWVSVIPTAPRTVSANEYSTLVILRSRSTASFP